MPPETPPRLWPYLLLYAIAAAALTFSRLHELHSSDTLVFPLSALYEWRPFFWEQDRVGLLWPLLLSWCRHPLAALVLHTWTTAFIGLCLPVVFCRVITPHRAAPVVATFASAAGVLFASPTLACEWLVLCNYPAALVFACLAILLLDQRGGGWVGWVGRVAVAWGLLFVAFWLYIGLPLFLLPFVVLRGWVPGPVPTRRWWGVVFRPFLKAGVWLTLVGAAAGIGGVYLLMQHTYQTEPSVQPTPHRDLPLSEWPGVYCGFYSLLFDQSGATEFATLIGVATAAGVGWGLWKDCRTLGRTAARCLPAVLAAAGEFAFLGTRFWVKNNSSHPRYLVAVLCVACLWPLLAGLVPVFGSLTRRWLRVVAVAGGLALLAAVVFRYGWPAADVPRRVMDERCAPLTADLLAADVDGVGGDYWQVWPVVYQLNLARYERGGGRIAWGVSRRSGPWEHHWRNTGQTYRVGVWAERGREGEDWPSQAEERGLEVLRELPAVGRVRVFEVRSAAPRP